MAAGDEAEDLVEAALDDRAHRVKQVREPASIHDIDASRDVFPDADALPNRRDAELSNGHPVDPGILISRPPLASCVGVDYSRRAAEYDCSRADETLDRDFWLRGLFDLGDLRRGERILDVGAGTGRFARLLSESNRVVALDASREMLEAGRGKGPFGRIRGDALRLPFREDSFDATMFVMVLHQLPELGLPLREAARVADKTVIATTDMSVRDLGIMGEAFPNLVRIDRARFPPIEAISRTLRAEGFAHVRVEERPYRRLLTVEQQLDRVRRRYLSTFDLLPPGEYEGGVRFLEKELPKRFPDGFDVRASFTFLGATR